MKKISIFFLFFAILSGVAKEKRFVSLAPSITEILFSLGQEKHLVGVTDFCKDPSGKTDLSQRCIGGIIQINYEAILAKKPSFVFVLNDQIDASKKLKKLGIKTLVVNHRSYEAVLESYLSIGKACNENKKALALHKKISTNISLLKKPKKKVRVLVTISSLYGQNNVILWSVGQEKFYNKFISLCGATNAYTGQLRYAQLAPEGLLSIDPDMIIILSPLLSKEKQKLEIKAWQKLSFLKAVKNKNVKIINHPSTLIPGSQIDKVLEQFSKAINE